MARLLAPLLLLLLLEVPPLGALALSGPNASCFCAGGAHTCIVTAVDLLLCWGSATFGRLGYGPTTGYASPSAARSAHPRGVQLLPNASAAVAKLVCADTNTLALLSDGSVHGWGRNAHGELGLAHTLVVGNAAPPFEAPGGPVTLEFPAIDVCAGMWHACAVLSLFPEGEVACWGDGSSGKLGYGNNHSIGDNETVSSAGWVQTALRSKAAAIFCGGHFTIALMTSGELRSWGANKFGQLGLGHTSPVGDDEHPSSQPVVQLGLSPGSAISGVSVGSTHACVFDAEGLGQCFGQGLHGRLGTGSEADVFNASKLPTINFTDELMQLEAFQSHTCGLLASGLVQCFGKASFGRLGCGYPCGDRFAPNEAVALSATVAALAVGSRARHVVAFLSDGQLQAWGWGAPGQLGYGNNQTVGDDETPASVGVLAFHDPLKCSIPSSMSLATSSISSSSSSSSSSTSSSSASDEQLPVSTSSSSQADSSPPSSPNTTTASTTALASTFWSSSFSSPASSSSCSPSSSSLLSPSSSTRSASASASISSTSDRLATIPEQLPASTTPGSALLLLLVAAAAAAALVLLLLGLLGLVVVVVVVRRRRRRPPGGASKDLCMSTIASPPDALPQQYVAAPDEMPEVTAPSAASSDYAHTPAFGGLSFTEYQSTPFLQPKQAEEQHYQKTPGG